MNRDSKPTPSHYKLSRLPSPFLCTPSQPFTPQPFLTYFPCGTQSVVHTRVCISLFLKPRLGFLGTPAQSVAIGFPPVTYDWHSSTSGDRQAGASRLIPWIKQARLVQFPSALCISPTQCEASSYPRRLIPVDGNQSGLVSDETDLGASAHP